MTAQASTLKKGQTNAPRGSHRGAFTKPQKKKKKWKNEQQQLKKKWGKEKQSTSNDAKRITILKVLIFLAFVLTFPRLISLQVIKRGNYQAIAEGQHLYYEHLIPERGRILIYDKFTDDPYPLATNEERYFMFAIPRDIEGSQKTLETLHHIFQFEEETKTTIQERLEKKNSGDLYEPIQHFVTRDQKEQIERTELPGLRFVPENKRFYPEGQLASHLLGFVSIKDEEQQGQYGIEEYYNDILKGKKGHIEAFLDTSGNWITSSKREIRPAVNGNDIVLSIDRTIQFIAEQELKAGIEEFEADSGSIMIQNPSTGEIIAMASYPTYDPNTYQDQEDIQVFLNNATQATYEPGSVMKPFTTSIPLNENLADTDTTYIDTGEVTMNGWTIKNSDEKAHGLKTLTEVLELSLNTGVIHFQQVAGLDNFEKYVLAFGFGSETLIDLAGEVAGNMRNLENKKSGINYATMSYGQGMSITPVGLLTSFSALINGGTLYRPYLAKEIRYADGNSVTTEPKEVRRVITEETSRKTKAMLASVVENGHAQKAQVDGYVVGGKTGTANIPGPGGYTNETNHTFIGFGPLEKPKFTILVHYHKPKGVIFSASSSAVSFQRLSKYLFDYYEIPPTKEYKERDNENDENEDSF